jgi:hypothetical protein
MVALVATSWLRDEDRYPNSMPRGQAPYYARHVTSSDKLISKLTCAIPSPDYKGTSRPWPGLTSFDKLLSRRRKAWLLGCLADMTDTVNTAAEKQEKINVSPSTDNQVEKPSLGAHGKAGYSVVEQGHTIPTTGARKTTTRWEYWSWCLYSMH